MKRQIRADRGSMEQTTLATPDSKLVDEIRLGVSEAETSLYERFSARVYYVALSETRSREDAEDVRAETFLRVLQSIRQGRLRSPGALAPFILSTAHNVIREHVRKDRRTESLDVEEVERTGKYVQEPVFLDSDVQRAVEQVVRRLKPREQIFLRMYYYEEKSKEEIARALGVKEERLRLVKSRALKNFREVYQRLTKTDDTK